MTYRFWSARLGIPFDSLELAAEGDLDVRGFCGLAPELRPGFTAVRIRVSITGSESRDITGNEPANGVPS